MKTSVLLANLLLNDASSRGLLNGVDTDVQQEICAAWIRTIENTET